MRTSVQVSSERKYTIRNPQFKLFENVRYLDADKLSKGSHTIELGSFDGCGCAVTANVRNGMIKGFNFPKCGHATTIPSKLAKKLRSARKRLLKVSPKWEDIPVRQLTTSAAARARIIVTTTTADNGCYEVCIDPGSGQKTCWICCTDDKGTWCIGPSDPQVAMF
jgi:hypothetical protein